MPRPAKADRVAELETALRLANEKLREMTRERDEAQELVTRMRQHVEDTEQVIDNWTDVFELDRGEDGHLRFDRNQSDLWQRHAALWDEHRKLIRQWNRFVGQYNAAVSPRERGRPIAASEAQRAEVLKQRKTGVSLRAIAKSTGLSLRTVCTVTGTPAADKRTNALRRREFDKRRPAAYRARLKARELLPDRIVEVQKTAAALIKAAKGLGR